MNELDRITINPELCMGQPTIRGIRITVSAILKCLGNGMSTKEILDAYPELDEKDIIQAIKYAAWLSSESTRPVPPKQIASS